MQPNERLRHHRLQRGWTQENEAEELAALAPALGEKHLPVTGRMVGKWERGEATPKGVYRRGLCLLFGATAEELGLYQPPEKGIEDMQRRAFLQGLGVLTGFAVASSFTYEPWERLSAALAQPRRLDDTAMRDLEAVTASLESQYATVAPLPSPAPSRATWQPSPSYLTDTRQRSWRGGCTPWLARSPGWPAGYQPTWASTTAR